MLSRVQRRPDATLVTTATATARDTGCSQTAPESVGSIPPGSKLGEACLDTTVGGATTTDDEQKGA